MLLLLMMMMMMMATTTCDTSGSNSGVGEDSILLECDIVKTGKFDFCLTVHHQLGKVI